MNEKGISYEDRNIKTQNPNALELKDKLSEISLEEQYQLLESDGMLVNSGN